MSLATPGLAGAVGALAVSGAEAAFIGLGANLGDARATLDAACQKLAGLSQTALVAVSPVYCSAPIDASGPDFFNAVAWLHTRLGPEALLAQLQRIELLFGRQRPYPHAPRTLDLDLLLVGEQTRNSPDLTLPHPRLHQRAFVLRPLLDLCPGLAAPGLGPLAGWLAATQDQRLSRLPGP